MTTTTPNTANNTTTTTSTSLAAATQQQHPISPPDSHYSSSTSSSSTSSSSTTTLTSSPALEDQLLERKITFATDGLINYVVKRLRNIGIRQNIETVCDYIIAMNAEINPSIM